MPPQPPHERNPEDHRPVLVDRSSVAAEVVDTLPEEVQPEYVLLSQFLAFVRGSRINVGGELEITLGVPFEYKYDAMPITDLRGLNFHVAVYRPVEPTHPLDGSGVGEEGASPDPSDPLSALLGR